MSSSFSLHTIISSFPNLESFKESMEKNQLPTITFGPYGGNGGAEWDDGMHDGVKKVIIYSGEKIDSIQVEYDDDWKSKHGGSGGVVHEITLDYPTEYLTSLSGYYGSEQGGITVVQSLTLKSNKREFGPYGTQNGTLFASEPLGIIGKIVGFLGRSGDLLDSIGAYFEIEN